MAVSTKVDDQLRRCQRSAVHLEMRDGYMLDDPDLHAWRAGYRHDVEDRASWWHPWHQLMADTVTRGVIARRARIVSEPISEYIHYEYDVTFTNVAVGEDVRWLPRRKASDLALPGNDFWLFDNEILLINHFSGTGDWIDVEEFSDPTTVALCALAFESVWERATPHADYGPT